VRLSLSSRLYAALYRLHLANNTTTVSYQASVGKYLHFLVRSPMHALTHLGPSLGLSHPLILGYRRPTMGRMILPQQPSCGLTRSSPATSTTITTTSSTSGTGIRADLSHGPASGIIRDSYASIVTIPRSPTRGRCAHYYTCSALTGRFLCRRELT
jgi:hypothetical protein